MTSVPDDDGKMIVPASEVFELRMAAKLRDPTKFHYLLCQLAERIRAHERAKFEKETKA